MDRKIQNLLIGLTALSLVVLTVVLVSMNHADAAAVSLVGSAVAASNFRRPKGVSAAQIEEDVAEAVETVTESVMSSSLSDLVSEENKRLGGGPE